jgi:uncharacterized membrane protein
MAPEIVQPFAEWCAAAIEALGLVLITGLSIASIAWAGVLVVRRRPGREVFRETRRRLAHGILLGLELLVAADIIHTVAVDLSFETVGVLAIVVAIRTFLSFALEVELNGRWPWQAAQGTDEL